MGEPIENEYFNWLCAKVLDRGSTNYQDLMRVLHQTEFIPFVHRDRNREQDGIELRIDFLNATGWFCDPDWYTEPCSMLEMMIAFAKRANFQTEIPVREWFWIFLHNLGLEEYRQLTHSDIPRIERLLNTFNTRRYRPDGTGGMFPVRNPRQDQREVEIWYQFCGYLEEQGLI